MNGRLVLKVHKHDRKTMAEIMMLARVRVVYCHGTSDLFMQEANGALDILSS